MRIPSYDDLTPSIPDIAPGEVLTSVAGLLPGSGPVAARVSDGVVAGDQLFAALSVQRPPQSPAPALPRSAAPALPRSPDLMAIARDFSPRVERHPGGTVVLDVSGLQRLFGEPAAIAEHLANAGAPSVAVARSQTAAILLSRARAGATVAIGDPETALRDIPIAVLEQYLGDLAAAAPPAPVARRPAGARRRRGFDVLRRWGLSTIGEWAALPAGELSARLGPDGVAMQRLARGLDSRPLIPDPGSPRFLATMELEWPIETLEPLSFVFARLLEPLAGTLERADRGAVALHLTLRLTDRSSHVRALPLPAPMRDPRVLRTLLLLDLESHPPSAAIDIVSIEIDPAPGRVVQYSLLERAVPSSENLATLMARLGALVGETRCGSPVLLDAHRPDAFAMAPPSFGERVNSQPPTANSQTESCQRPGRTSVRCAQSEGCPPLLSNLSNGELGVGDWKLGVGSWEFRRDSDSPRAVLRRFRPPVAVRVLVDAGRPVRVAVDRRGMPGGTVRQAAGPWRSSGEWWERGRWNHDEWDVALGDGAVCRLFHDRDGGGWFIAGVYD